LLDGRLVDHQLSEARHNLADMVGQTISHYKVLSEVGRGGMGVVYKAEDTKLKRPVALKFLRSDVLEDEEHKERFLREAQAAAALDHPNIWTVYEIDEADGQTFLSMAYLEGETVKEKIKARPLKLEDALDIAIQTAQGLQAAHEKGIVHRDIKSANLMVTPQGPVKFNVKIMDFGLAQLAERSQLTKTTTILGTPAYMSPEQSQRLPTDRRTDIWSLGIVVYEMVTGRLPFEGERQEAILYAIGGEEPEPITALRVGVPTELDRVVGKALAKSPDERYQHVDELLVDLRALEKSLAQPKEQKASSASSSSRGAQRQVSWPAPVVAPGQTVPMRNQRMLQALLTFAVIAFLALAFVYFGETPPEAPETPLRRFALAVEGAQVHGVATSLDGRHIAYTTGRRESSELWIWDLDRLTPRKIETAREAVRPFWTPNSDFVAFRSPGQRELKKVSVYGEPASVILYMPPDFFCGGASSQDGSSIVFSSRDEGHGVLRLYEVPAQGGTAKPLFEPE